MILQTSTTSQTAASNSFWFDFFGIFLNIIVPVILLCVAFFALYKFYKLFKEMSTSFKVISETYKRKNERGEN